eukprot:760117-Prymnesium_polylepis.1
MGPAGVCACACAHAPLVCGAGRMALTPWIRACRTARIHESTWPMYLRAESTEIVRLDGLH